MIASRAIAALMLAATALLSACSSEGTGGERAPSLELANAARAAFGRGPAAARAAPLLNRAQIEAYPVPLDLIVLEQTRASALVFQVGQNGGVETWASADGKTVALRQGVLLSTRGLGPDLMGSVAPSVTRLASAGDGAHERVIVTLGGEDQTLRARYICTLEARGTEALTIIERRYTARHVRETCSGDSGAFVNDFWFQGSTLRQSRQWAGPGTGHITLQRLRS